MPGSGRDGTTTVTYLRGKGKEFSGPFPVRCRLPATPVARYAHSLGSGRVSYPGTLPWFERRPDILSDELRHKVVVLQGRVGVAPSSNPNTVGTRVHRSDTTVSVGLAFDEAKESEDVQLPTTRRDRG